MRIDGDGSAFDCDDVGLRIDPRSQHPDGIAIHGYHAGSDKLIGFSPRGDSRFRKKSVESQFPGIGSDRNGMRLLRSFRSRSTCGSLGLFLLNVGTAP